MRTLTLIAASAAVLLPAVATAEPTERTFSRDGHTYVYTTTAREKGRTLIEGHEVGANARFRLLVDGTYVTGQANGYPVSFRAAQPLAPTSAATN